ncbi:hypothetical protein FB565_001782 [Actinoplanes lutulentus]|uniref:Lipoprotein n=1 Tax=Actinoplanes lutulentus TaxID=1287878 RepID=A0A327YZA3_9ACTN|nr:hypothetical protein [Actinoplanes lutulentus]MBB2942069.1 hypothetical protein [Actinoplanes lutulentus]RAK26977.1 hypothetical protein B0I29_125134 [Actinoplanes lutulentus]
MTKRWTALIAAIAMIGTTSTACGSEPADAVIGSPDAAAATEQALRALEADATFGQETTQDPGWHPICAGRPMGLSPEDVDPRTVYAWIYCKWVRDGVDDGASLPGIASPVVVHLTSPMRYELPQDGDDYPKSIDEIFPPNLREAALGGSPEESAVLAELDAKVIAAQK